MADKINTLYIETSKSPRTALVTGVGSNKPVTQFQSFVSGDTINLKLFLLTSGVIDPDISGQSDVFVKAGFGQYGGSTVYASSSNWYPSASAAYTGSINTNTTAMATAMIGNESITALFEMEVTSSNSRRTYVQTPVQIFNEVIGQTPV